MIDVVDVAIGIKGGQEQSKVLGDLSMMLCDPYAVHFLATSALKMLNNLVASEALPREHHVLLLLLRMLALGLSAWQMIDSQEFREPRLDSQVVTKFLPALMSLTVDDQVGSFERKTRLSLGWSPWKLDSKEKKKEGDSRNLP